MFKPDKINMLGFGTAGTVKVCEGMIFLGSVMTLAGICVLHNTTQWFDLHLSKTAVESAKKLWTELDKFSD